MASHQKSVFKAPKGTRDYVGIDYIQRQKILDACRNVFELYNVCGMSTPIFELSETLEKPTTHELSEVSELSDTAKQTFKLEPEYEGSERYTMRYDNTMSLARYVRENKIKKLRRYTMGTVYRMDQPNMKNGRFREFMQCDFDNISQSEFACTKAEDAETLTIIINILLSLKLTKQFKIRLNLVSILKDLYRWCDIPENMFQTTTRTLDKLDKLSQKQILKELHDKGLPEESANKVLITLNRYKKTTIYDIIEDKVEFISPESKEYLRKLFDYLNTMMPSGTIDNIIVCDFKLARGLDYYTGIIFEAQPLKSKIGSIAAGGRYDELCGEGIGCVGFSIGVDRLLKLMPQIPKKERSITVWIIQTNCEDADIVFKYRLWLLTTLRGANISCGTEMKPDSSIAPQLRYAIKNEIKYAIFVGDEEVQQRTVTLKNLEKCEEVKVSETEAIERIKSGI
jgi:histidyl-tRNA synthetase